MNTEQATSEVKDKIIEAARELFVRKGYNGVSIRDIAASSDTNVAMVNYYFRSKYNLFADIFDEAFTIISGKIFTLLEADLPFFDMIREWIYAYYDVLSQYPNLPLFIVNELSQQPEIMDDVKIIEKPRQLFNRVAVRFKEEQDKGTIRQSDMIDFGLNVISLCLFPFIFRPIAHSFLNLSQDNYNDFLQKHKEYVADFVINAIKNPNN